MASAKVRQVMRAPATPALRKMASTNPMPKIAPDRVTSVDAVSVPCSSRVPAASAPRTAANTTSAAPAAGDIGSLRAVVVSFMTIPS